MALLFKGQRKPIPIKQLHAVADRKVRAVAGAFRRVVLEEFAGAASPGQRRSRRGPGDGASGQGAPSQLQPDVLFTSEPSCAMFGT